MILPPGSRMATDQADPDFGSDSDESLTSSQDDKEDNQDKVPDFAPGECLFCGVESGLEENITHMSTVHGFRIPYESSLTVDKGTLLWYLHLVINGYNECIFCAKKRRSSEAIQQHMLAKGHCRFDVAGEYADFYNLTSSEIQDSSNLVQPEEGSLRLPSGKLLSHRSHAQQASSRPHTTRQTSDQPQQQQVHGPAVNPAGASTSPDSTAMEARNQKLEGLALQLSRLSANDRNSLMHLPVSEQRSALVVRRKQIDKAQREEIRARRRVETLGNKTLMKHFKIDVPGRSNG